MAYYPTFNISASTPASTYQNLVQFNHLSSSLITALGNELTESLNLSASYAISASWAPFIDTGTTLFTGSTYQITSSWSNNSISTSYIKVAETASYVSGLTTTVYLTASVTTMSFVNGLLQSVS